MVAEPSAMMYGESDAAAAMELPTRWTARPSAGLRVQGLERCRRRGLLGASASSATSLGARQFATIDPEDFYDFQATRPQIKLTDGQTRSIEWPEVKLYEVRVPRAPRDLVLLAGASRPTAGARSPG